MTQREEEPPPFVFETLICREGWPVLPSTSAVGTVASAHGPGWFSGPWAHPSTDARAWTSGREQERNSAWKGDEDEGPSYCGRQLRGRPHPAGQRRGDFLSPLCRWGSRRPGHRSSRSAALQRAAGSGVAAGGCCGWNAHVFCQGAPVLPDAGSWCPPSSRRCSVLGFRGSLGSLGDRRGRAVCAAGRSE